jgi:hypothetical protein
MDLRDNVADRELTDQRRAKKQVELDKRVAQHANWSDE